MRKIANPDVLEFHVALPTGVQLQGNFAIERSGLGVGEVHHGHAVETGPVPISDDLDEIVVPFAHPDYALVFRRRPDHPSAPVFRVYAGGMMHHFAVDLELHTLGYIRGSGLECTMEEDSAVAVPHALEAERKLKVFVVFFSLQITVVFGE